MGDGRMGYDVDEKTKPLLISKQEIQIHVSGTLRTKSNYTVQYRTPRAKRQGDFWTS